MDMAATSANEDVKTMLRDAIMAVQAASAAAHKATLKESEQANDPELKDVLQQAAKHSETWRERLAQAASAVGGGTAQSDSNPIVDAIQQVGGKIIQKAQDPVARDLGVIASSQLATHYYISAFGTMAAYANMLGLKDVAGTIHQCLQEAKHGDERYTQLAARIGKGS